MQEPVVEAEHRHHAVVVVQRRPKRRVVVQPQVTAKPDEDGHCEIPSRITSGPRSRQLLPWGKARGTNRGTELSETQLISKHLIVPERA